MYKYIIIILLFFTQTSISQIRYGVIGGVNFPFVRSGLSNIRSLPIDKGGMNLTIGFQISTNFTDEITLQSGLNALKTGFTYGAYDEFYGIEFDQYNVSNVLSLPLNVFYNFIPKDEYGVKDLNFTASLGAGIYGNYLINGKITDEDGAITKATYNNLKRFDTGVSIIGKVSTFQHFDVIVSYQYGLSNLLKTGNGKLSQDGFFLGVAYHF
jgi:hypothetical protein